MASSATPPPGRAGTIDSLERPVQGRLSPYVHSIQGFAEYDSAPFRNTQLPTATVPLIIMLGSEFASHTGNKCYALPDSFVAGVHTQPVVIGSTGQSSCMQIDLTPIGACRLLRTNMANLANELVNLHDLLGARLRRLEDKLRCTTAWPGRFQITGQFLEEALFSRHARTSAVSEAAFNSLQASDGRMSISQLAQTTGCSRKHLHNLFKREVGVPPKIIARVLRFEHALTQLTSASERDPGPPADLVEVAMNNGYSDQAHFTREFVFFSGTTPSAFRSAFMRGEI